MILNFINTDFTLDTGVYYSKPFKISSDDSIITTSAVLTGAGDVSLQCGIDGVNWGDIAETVFACNTFGIQQFSYGDPNILYRLKATVAPTSAQIVI